MYTLVRQRDAKDCGPSCLAMIIKHYGRDFNIDSIRTCLLYTSDAADE